MDVVPASQHQQQHPACRIRPASSHSAAFGNASKSSHNRCTIAHIASFQRHPDTTCPISNAMEQSASFAASRGKEACPFTPPTCQQMTAWTGRQAPAACCLTRSSSAAASAGGGTPCPFWGGGQGYQASHPHWLMSHRRETHQPARAHQSLLWCLHSCLLASCSALPLAVLPRDRVWQCLHCLLRRTALSCSF